MQRITSFLVNLDPTAGGFLQILLNFSGQLFYLTPVNGYFYPSLLRKRFKFLAMFKKATMFNPF